MPILRHPVIVLAGRIIGMLLVFSLLLSVFDTYKKLGITKEYEALYAQTRAANERLKQALAEAQSPEFTERQARDKLGLVKEGESLVLMKGAQVSPAGPADRTVLGSQTADEASLPNWKRWWKLFF